MKHLFPKLFTVLLSVVLLPSYGETIYVTNTSDAGPGSFRQAINDANSDPGSTSIQFDFSDTSDHIIHVPHNGLPAFTAPVAISISFSQTVQTILLGAPTNQPGPTTALTFNPGSEGSTVMDISIKSFVFGIVINTHDISVYWTQFSDSPGGIDIRLNTNADNVFVRGCLFTSARHDTYAIYGTGNNLILLGNYIDGESIAILNSNNVSIGGFGPPAPNTILNSGSDALTFYQVSGSHILNNTISNSGGGGLNISGNGNLIQSNRLSGNIGFDIIVKGNENSLDNNKITGNAGMFSGISAKGDSLLKITSNSINGGSIELTDVKNSIIGGSGADSNTVINDPQGFTAHGAISCTNVNNSSIVNNVIHDNSSTGIYLLNSSSNLIFQNDIYNNGRVGIVVNNGSYDRISQNIIYNNHADIYGGKTGIALISGNNNKTAPVITSIKRVGDSFVISGTGTLPNDLVQIFLSDAASRNSTLVQNAKEYLTSIVAHGHTWTATVDAISFQQEDVYFIATSTDHGGNTSSFSNAKEVEINGPVDVCRNQAYNYATAFIPNTNFQWWVNGDAAITSGQGTSNVKITFGSSYHNAFVSVGFTDPLKGWVVYKLKVTASHGCNTNESSLPESIAISSEIYPNPFSSTTNVLIHTLNQASLNLFDLFGNLVYTSEGHISGDVIELGQKLKPGLYSLQIISGSEIKYFNILKE